MKVTENITKIREELGISKSELAKRLGVSDSVVSRIESENRELKVSDLAKIAKALKVREIDLLTWPDRYVLDPNQHDEVEAILQIKLKQELKQRLLRELFDKEDIILLDKNM